MMIFRPYQVMKEIWIGSIPSTDVNSLRAVVSPLLGWWWGAWLVSSRLGTATFRGMIGAESADELMTADYLSLVADVISILALVLIFLLVKRITDHQLIKGGSEGENNF